MLFIIHLHPPAKFTEIASFLASFENKKMKAFRVNIEVKLESYLRLYLASSSIAYGKGYRFYESFCLFFRIDSGKSTK